MNMNNMNNNKRESLMKRIQMYAFTAHECTLYLDCHPNNRKAMEKHSMAVKKMNEAVAQYEEMYGPLTANSATTDGKYAGWSWVTGKWPWQISEVND